MRVYVNQVDPVTVDTELGKLMVAPKGIGGASVNGPHLTVDGVPLQASAFLVSAEGLKWSLIQQFDSASQRFSPAPDAIQARLVDGRTADTITLDTLVAAIQPAVERLAQAHPELFLEAERRRLNNEIFLLEREIRMQSQKIEEKEREIAAIEARLPDRS